MRRILGFSVFVVVAPWALAQAKPFVAWAIDPAVPGSATIEVWPVASTTSGHVWRLVARDGKVLDEMPQPALPPGYAINYGQCRREGVERHDLVAIVRHAPDQEWSRDVRSVWVVNPDSETLAVASTAGVACRNEGYGL